MTHHLTQKEEMLLQDQKSHEEVCIAKYKEYANQVSDPNLKQLLNIYAKEEEQHLDTINQMLQSHSFQAQGSGQTGADIQALTAESQQSNQQDATMLNDLLMTEKYVSDTYNTAVFEFKDSTMRQALNHIQREEQQHGEGLFNYMYNNGMYTIE